MAAADRQRSGGRMKIDSDRRRNSNSAAALARGHRHAGRPLQSQLETTHTNVFRARLTGGVEWCHDPHSTAHVGGQRSRTLRSTIGRGDRARKGAISTSPPPLPPTIYRIKKRAELCAAAVTVFADVGR